MDIQPLLSFFIVLFSFAIYSLLHSILASLRFKAWLSEQLGEAWMQRWYRLIFNVLGVLTLLPIFYLMAVLPDRLLYVVPFPWRWLNYALQLFGAWVLYDSVRRTGMLEFLGLRQMVSAGSAEGDFTRSGYYRRVRHPLYSGGMLFFWASASMSVLSAAFYLAMSLYFWIGAIFEERKLAAHFGQAYVDYAAETPMFVPKIIKR